MVPGPNEIAGIKSAPGGRLNLSPFPRAIGGERRSHDWCHLPAEARRDKAPEHAIAFKAEAMTGRSRMHLGAKEARNPPEKEKKRDNRERQSNRHVIC